MTRTAAQVFTIESGENFAASLARGLKGRFEVEGDPLALARVTLFVPTRRAVQSIARAFQDLDPHGVTLMPHILPLGDVGEDDMGLGAGFESGPEGSEDMSAGLPPAISGLKRQLLLARMIQMSCSGGLDGSALSSASAAALAADLARFFDTVETEEVDLSGLERLVPDDLAEHWRVTVEFLEILTHHWPGLLEQNGVMDPARRRSLLLRQLAERWAANPPKDPVVIAGSTGSIPATQELMGAVLRLDKGLLVLPGLDMDMSDDEWAKVDETHPQYGLKHLLAADAIGLARRDVALWEGDGGLARNPDLALRRRVFSQVMLPAEATENWLAFVRDEEVQAQISGAFEGLSVLAAAEPRLEALAVSLIIREALETPGRTAALVTPDRGLARRVSMELRRWGLEIDDSAGRPLTGTPVGTFLSLILEVAVTGFAPAPFLSLLKHPLTALGLSRRELRRIAAQFEMRCLRGVRPSPGIEGLRQRIATDKAASKNPHFALLLDRLEAAFAPLLQSTDGMAGDFARAHLEVAETLAASFDEGKEVPGAGRLWVGDAGESAATFFADFLEEEDVLGQLSLPDYASLFDVLLEGRVARARYGTHPRAFIWGPLEARLQSADVLVLGGLTEKSWPQAAQSDPWLSRPMRAALGLSQPERRIGQSAHDFVQLASAPKVYLTYSQKADGAPTVPSRWVMRLENMLKGLKADHLLKPDLPVLGWAEQLDLPAQHTPIAEPAPCPPVEARPRRLSVTQIETWLRDPYAIYARHILRLRVLDDLDLAVGALEKGNAIHKALERFIEAHPDALPDDSAALLMSEALKAFDEVGASQEELTFWVPRFRRIADWFLAFEAGQRLKAKTVGQEEKGEVQLAAPGGVFTLNGRGDRFDLFRDGRFGVYDYKTGRMPSVEEVEALLAPQLPLEGLILRQSGFGPVGPGETVELGYIQLKGGAEPGDTRILDADPAGLIDAAEQSLKEYIAAFDSETMPYRVRVMPKYDAIAGDYDHLARVKEWAVYGSDGGGET